MSAVWERLDFEPVALDCRPPFSFYFRVVRRFWKSSSAEPRSLHRICTLARKMGVQTLVVESVLSDSNPDDPDKSDVTDEIDDLDRELGPDGQAEVLKFSFFRDLTDLDGVGDLGDKSLIGQAILVNYRPRGEERFSTSYVYQAIFEVPRIKGEDLELLNNYYHTRRDYSVAARGRLFTINGVHFCQQNGITHVCAHATLRMALNTVTPDSELISNRSIHTLLGVDPAEVFVNDIERVLAERQLEPYVWRFEEVDAPVNYIPLVYSIVESGHPALLVFSTANHEEDHVIGVWGHTLNSDEWHPQAQRLYAGPRSAQYYPSSAWADHFLIHDDNLGPYYCLARDALLTHQAVGPRYVIGLFPRRIAVSPVVAENLASSALKAYLPELAPYGQGEWWRYMVEESPTYVLRTLLVERDRYLNHLVNAPGHDSSCVREHELAPFRASLPDEFWMTEFSLPSLYAGNKTKLGELLVASTGEAGQGEVTPTLLAMRFPSGMFVLEDELRGRFYGSECRSHIPLIRNFKHGNEW